MQIRRLTLVLLTGFITACATPSDMTLVSAGVDIPQHWQQDSKTNSFSDIIQSPVLDQLIQEALVNNRDLQASAQRLKASQQQLSVASGSLLPAINLGVEQARNGRENQPVADTATAYLAVSWELDVWGRLADSQASAHFSAQQQASNYHFAQLSLAAQVASGWLDAVEAQRQLQLAKDRQENLQRNFEIIRDGFRHGIRDALDVYSAKAELASAKTASLQRQQSLHEQLRNLSVLLGRYPDAALDIPAQLAINPASLPEQLSVNLLERRPDIQAGASAVFSQQANVGVAKANRLPQLTLSGRYGNNAEKLSEVLSSDDVVWNLITGITAPLFQGGQLVAEQRRQEALLHAAVADYRQLVLRALQEVEQGIDNDHLLNEQLHTAAETVQASGQAQTQAFERYIAGLENMNTWLQSQRSYFTRRSELMQLEVSLLKNRISLHLALGGDFTGTMQ